MLDERKLLHGSIVAFIVVGILGWVGLDWAAREMYGVGVLLVILWNSVERKAK